MSEDLSKTKLPGGLVGELDGNKYFVHGPEFTNLQESLDYAFGDSLEEAQAIYWKRKLEDSEAVLLSVTKEASEAASVVKTLREGFQTSNAEAILRDVDAKDRLTTTEKTIKLAAERLYSLIGEREPGNYVKVNEKAVGISYDKDKALEWCRENMKAAVLETLDTASFESYSKVRELDFVTENDKVPSAQLTRKKIEADLGN